MKHVRVQVVTYGSRPLIDGCLQALLRQDYPGLQALVLDNASTDGCANHVRRTYPDVQVVQNATNLGFARAHNLGFAAAGDADYIMPLNPDCELEPGCISTLVAAEEVNPRAGSLQPKLLRPESRTIDTTGVCLPRSRRAYDRGQGEEDRGQYDNAPDIFCANGAAPLYRRDMLEDIRIGNEYFDEDFFAYKEDVDLGWRARLLGWEAVFVPGAVGRHARGWGQETARSRVSRDRRFHSLKNRYLTLLKNERLPPPLADWPSLLGYELLVLGGVLLREPFLLRAYYEALRLAPRALDRRRELWARKRVSVEEMTQWFR